jgi:hypothetical protein
VGYNHGFTSLRNVKGAAQKCLSGPVSWFPISFGKADAPVSAAFFRLRGPLQAALKGRWFAHRGCDGRLCPESRHLNDFGYR